MLSGGFVPRATEFQDLFSDDFVDMKHVQDLHVQDPSHQALWDEVDSSGALSISIPSLHIIGETDSIVTPERQQELLGWYEMPDTHVHPGGHFIPPSAQNSQHYLQFLAPFKPSQV